MNSSPAEWQVEAPKIWLLLGLAMLVFSSPSGARAEGFRNPYQNPAAMAQGNAFTAQADDASAVYYNPAGMTQLSGIQFFGGIEFVHIDTRYRSFTGAKTENDLGGAFGFPPPAQLFITTRPRDLGMTWLGDLTAGLGLSVGRTFANRGHGRDLATPRYQTSPCLPLFRMARSR